MIDSLHNNSNQVGVRINDLNNNTSKNEYVGATKTNYNGSYWVWKVEIANDYVVDGNTSILVSANRGHNSPFGGPLLTGESRKISYSLDEGNTWEVLVKEASTIIPGTKLTVKQNPDNNETSLMGIIYPGDPDLVGNVEIVFKVEMEYASPATAPEIYKGPEYIDFVLRGKETLRGFVDPTNNILFDGHKPYVFWMPGQGQSIGMNYSMTLWAVGTSETITVSMPQNSVFHLLDNRLLANPEEGTFDTIQNLFVDEVEIYGAQLGNDYVYPIYVYGMTMTPGEFTHPIIIEGEEYTVGMDAYMENESLYINLANMGVELPDSIQKAIYPSNVREEKKDNILMNRKLKELISQYWDVLAGRGSYKSLINSLNWFEWGDLISLREIWARDGVMQTKYFVDEKLSSLLTEEYKGALTVFKKTTYLAIYHALQKAMVTEDGIVYDTTQQVPVLEPVVSRWSKEDLSLKLAMLGAFYETFFMPIHLELLHCTIEDIVFTDSFRSVFGGNLSRLDHSYQSYEIECNVNDGDEFVLHNCSTQTNWDTLFAWDWEREFRGLKGNEDDWSLRGTDQYTADILANNEVQKESRAYETAVVVGCEDVDSYATNWNWPAHDLSPDGYQTANPSRPNYLYNATSQDDYFKNFYTQKFAGVGVIVPFQMKLEFPNGQTESIHRERLYVLELDDEGNVLTTIYRESHTGISSTHSSEWSEELQGPDDKEVLQINFNLLFTRDSKWQLRFEFDTTAGDVITKILNIRTLDLSNATIDVMKVRPMTAWEIGTRPYDESILKYGDVTDYMMRMQPFVNLGEPEEEGGPNTWIPQHYSIFLPCYTAKDIDGRTDVPIEENCSIKKCSILVYDVSGLDTGSVNYIVNTLSSWYDIFKKYPITSYVYDTQGNVTNVNFGSSPSYIVAVSTRFYSEADPNGINLDSLINTSLGSYKDRLYRNDRGFIGWKHTMDMVGERLIDDVSKKPTRTDVWDDYVIYNNEVICVVPDIRWGHEIDPESIEWEFKNVSLNKTYNIKSLTGDNISTQSPFVASKERLTPGFYDIIFRYRLKKDPTPRVLVRNSAFKLLDEPRVVPASPIEPDPTDDSGTEPDIPFEDEQ